jgi:hypothetical protein
MINFAGSDTTGTSASMQVAAEHPIDDGGVNRDYRQHEHPCAPRR